LALSALNDRFSIVCIIFIDLKHGPLNVDVCEQLGFLILYICLIKKLNLRNALL